MRIQIIVDSEARRTVLIIEDKDMLDFKRALFRATNTWQNMPQSIRELTDVLAKHAAS